MQDACLSSKSLAGSEAKRICVRLCDNKLLEIRGDGITSKTKLQPEVFKLLRIIPTAQSSQSCRSNQNQKDISL